MEVPDVAIPRRGGGLLPADDRRVSALAKPCTAKSFLAPGSAGAKRGALDWPSSLARGAGGEREESGGKTLQPCRQEQGRADRRKAFAKLDTNGNGALSFEEWAVTTISKIHDADKDHNGWLSPVEYASTAPPPPKHRSCSCSG